MNQDSRRVLLVGAFPEEALERSYERAFASLGYETLRFDVPQELSRAVRFGFLGSFFNRFVPIEPWIRKMGRQLVIRAIIHQPDLILNFGHYPVRAGALAQIRSSFSVPIIHVWPDPFQNWDTHMCAALPLLDLVATYSRYTIESFHQLGARRAVWLPFAGDPALHHPTTCSLDERHRYQADISFIGSWRPEREAALMKLTNFNLKIWGSDWGRRCRGNTAILKAWQGRAAYGEEFSKIVACTKINLNVVEVTNYPGANMRFFEIPSAGGFQLSSMAPEMAEAFRDWNHIVYYRNYDELPQLVTQLLQMDEQRKRMAAAAHAQIINLHTYVHRASQLLELMEAER